MQKPMKHNTYSSVSETNSSYVYKTQNIGDAMK